MSFGTNLPDNSITGCLTSLRRIFSSSIISGLHQFLSDDSLAKHCNTSIAATLSAIEEISSDESATTDLNSRKCAYSIDFDFVSLVSNDLSLSTSSWVKYLLPLVISCFLIQSSGTLLRFDLVTSMNQPICRLCLTFKDGMSKSSLRVLSRALNQDFPSLEILLNSSSSSSNPSIIRPPSLTVSGGLSTKVVCIFVARGVRISISAIKAFRSSSSHSLTVSLRFGSLMTASAIATKSLPSALPWLNLIARRSMSLIPLSNSLTVSKRLDERINFPTASCRDFNAEAFLNGFRSHLFKHLLPIAVLQALMLPSKLPS